MRRSSVSALRRHGRRFQRRELAGVGVERVRAAEGDGLVAAGVAEGCPERHRDGELAQALRNDFFPALRIFARRREIAHHERLRPVEDGRIAIADQELARESFQLAGEAEEAVSAAREDERLGVAAERRLELALATRVVSSEVAGARKNLLAEARGEPDLSESVDASLEAFALEGAGGSDDVDRIAGMERFHPRSVS